jgi:hypothetical protein
MTRGGPACRIPPHLLSPREPVFCTLYRDATLDNTLSLRFDDGRVSKQVVVAWIVSPHCCAII